MYFIIDIISCALNNTIDPNGNKRRPKSHVLTFWFAPPLPPFSPPRYPLSHHNRCILQIFLIFGISCNRHFSLLPIGIPVALFVYVHETSILRLHSGELCSSSRACYLFAIEDKQQQNRIVAVISCTCVGTHLDLPLIVFGKVASDWVVNLLQIGQKCLGSFERLLLVDEEFFLWLFYFVFCFFWSRTPVIIRTQPLTLYSVAVFSIVFFSAYKKNLINLPTSVDLKLSARFHRYLRCQRDI